MGLQIDFPIQGAHIVSLSWVCCVKFSSSLFDHDLLFFNIEPEIDRTQYTWRFATALLATEDKRVLVACFEFTLRWSFVWYEPLMVKMQLAT